MNDGCGIRNSQGAFTTIVKITKYQISEPQNCKTSNSEISRLTPSEQLAAPHGSEGHLGYGPTDSEVGFPTLI